MRGYTHGIVDARRDFVSQLLSDLANALALPAPLTDTFLFDPSPAFYDACTESVVGLQRAARKVIDHLGLACGSVVVTLVSNPGAPGKIERAGTDWFVEIDAQYRHDFRTLGAILAHECCHILLAERGIQHFDNALDEVNVDLAAMLTGLGALTLNAISDQLRRQRLGYAPPGDHLVIPCPSLTCTARLRIPTRPGAATCPTCGTRRELAGHGVTTRALAAPIPLEPRAVPKARRASTLGLRWRVLPLRKKVVYSLAPVLAAAAVAVVIDQHPPRVRAPLGATCALGTDCDSGTCLSSRDSVYSTSTYCSRTCDRDDDCPATMVCGDAEDRSESPPEHVRACLKR